MSDEREAIYAAKPLLDSQHIRVLDILPADNFEDRFQCNLRVVPLGTSEVVTSGTWHEYKYTAPSERSEERYQTLSYAWGTLQNCKTIFCDDKPFTISEDLDLALRRIREMIPLYYNYIPTMWVDAICINQDDMEEKRAQVAVMGRIYQFSSGLVVWLGEAGSLSTSELLNALYDPQAPKSLNTLRIIANMPWFGRRWIIQEVFKSPLGKKNALIGSFQCSLDRVLLALQGWPIQIDVPLPRGFFRKGPDLATIAPKARRSYRSDKWSRSVRYLPSIMDNLLDFRKSKCSNAHDTVFAMLGISREGEDISIDYGQSLDSLNLAVARAIVFSSQMRNSPLPALTLLAIQLRQRLGTNTALPSWVPDWQALNEIPYSSIREVTERLNHTFRMNLISHCEVDESDRLSFSGEALDTWSMVNCSTCTTSATQVKDWLQGLDPISCIIIPRNIVLRGSLDLLFFLEATADSRRLRMRSYLRNPDIHKICKTHFNNHEILLS